MLRLAALALLLFVAASFVLASACRTTEGPIGVHVVVSLGDGFAPTDAFDHVTVVAKGAGKTAVVCLSPQGGQAAAFVVEAAAGDPCADELRLAWESLPTVATWKLDQAPRTMNIEGFEEGDEVTVVAEARLGGGRALARAEGTASAALGTSLLALALGRAHIDGDCGAVLGGALLGDASTLDFACEPSSTCLCAYEGLTSGAATTCLGSADGVTCRDGGYAIDPAAIASCADHDVLRRSLGTIGARSCIEVGLFGHLYRCLDDAEPCVPTTDCVPPPSLALAVRRAVGGGDAGATTLACLPPLAFGVPFVVPVRGQIGVVASLIALSMERSTDPKACRLDLRVLGFSECPK